MNPTDLNTVFFSRENVITCGLQSRRLTLAVRVFRLFIDSSMVWLKLISLLIKSWSPSSRFSFEPHCAWWHCISLRPVEMSYLIVNPYLHLKSSGVKLCILLNERNQRVVGISIHIMTHWRNTIEFDSKCVSGRTGGQWNGGGAARCAKIGKCAAVSNPPLVLSTVICWVNCGLSAYQ